MSSNLDDETCIRAELAIAAFVTGGLPDHECAWLFAHAMSCDLCLRALVETANDEREIATTAWAEHGGERTPTDPAPAAGYLSLSSIFSWLRS